MSAPASPRSEWSRLRWLLTLVGAVGLQVGLIFALGERTPPRPRPAGPVQSLQLSAARTEVQALLDPTLFARPHAMAFSAGSWLRGNAPVFPVFRWAGPARPLELTPEQLGTALGQFLHTNVLASISLEARPAPELLVSGPDEMAEALPARSQLAIVGELAARTLLNPPRLPPQPAEDLLTNSLVRVRVDAAGRVLSAVLLGAERVNGGSGSPEADRTALEVARGLQFAPLTGQDWLSNPVAELTRGILVFQWRTVPATNEVHAPGKSP